MINRLIVFASLKTLVLSDVASDLKVADGSNDGNLDKNEFAQYRINTGKQEGVNASEEQVLVDYEFYAADVDSNNYLDLNEVQAYETQYELFHAYGFKTTDAITE